MFGFFEKFLYLKNMISLAIVKILTIPFLLWAVSEISKRFGSSVEKFVKPNLIFSSTSAKVHFRKLNFFYTPLPFKFEIFCKPISNHSEKEKRL